MDFKRLQNKQTGSIKYYVDGERVAPHIYHDKFEECQEKGLYNSSLTVDTGRNYRHTNSFN